MENPSELSLPKQGLGRQSVLENIDEMCSEDPDYKKGRTWGLVYYAGEEHNNFLKDVHARFSSKNALNPMAFKSLKNMERDVIRMTTELFHGDEKSCGVMTSGGTESIMMAILAYRQRARKLKPWIMRPEIIVPDSIHVAFDKACKYFDVKIVHAPLNDDFTVDTKWVKKRAGRNTILIVGSAPQYPHGVIDDIEELGRIGLRKNIPVHVDACLGGFIVPFLEKGGHNVRKFDYRVPGVTSISADLHKYGFAAKGASTITYRSMEYLKHQFFVYENWPGGIFASPAMLGTRSGGPIAAAWATLKAIGEDGYIQNAMKILSITQDLMNKINAIPEMTVIGKPETCVFAYTTKDKSLNIYAIADRLAETGWHVDRNQKPESLHAMVTLGHADFIDEFVAALKEAVEYIKQNPEKGREGNAAMYGMVAKFPVRTMIKSQVMKMMEKMYSSSGTLPGDEPESALEESLNKVAMEAIEIKEKIENRVTQFKENLKSKMPF